LRRKQVGGIAGIYATIETETRPRTRATHSSEEAWRDLNALEDGCEARWRGKARQSQIRSDRYQTREPFECGCVPRNVEFRSRSGHSPLAAKKRQNGRDKPRPTSGIAAARNAQDWRIVFEVRP
jgi:hypothetical protein